MKLILMVVSCLMFVVGTVVAQDSIRVQKYSITGSSGTIEFWSQATSRWLTYQDGVPLTNGTMLATRDTSTLQITFEPAIIVNVKPNSVIKMNNLQVYESKKMIRTMLTMQNGDIELKTSGLLNSTLLLSVSTPSAVISINSADLLIHVVNDSTVVSVSRGEVKVENTGSSVKSTVLQGYQAVVVSSKPDIDMSSVSQIPVVEKSQKQPSIAILSIQAQGINKDNVSHVANYVAERYQEASNGAKVLFLDDIREMLRMEQGERLLDCFTDSCISKIGNVLGVDLVIIGNIGQLGNNYMFSLKMVDVQRDKTLKRITKTVESDVGLILNEIPTMVDNLASVQKTIAVDNSIAPVPAGKAGTEPSFTEKEIWINGGSFKMGVDFDGKTFDAVPVHTVKLHGFYMDKYEVTREEFQKVTGVNPSTFRGCGKCPVENVTWTEADAYCKKLGKRLPTEAEWEYACRAGTTTKFYYGDVLSGDDANFDSRYPYGGVPASTPKNRPIPVGEYKPNAWGLQDMHGNVAEWCSDWYDAAYYGNSPDSIPTGPKDGKLKVVRGGAWNGAATTLLSGKRFAYNKEMRFSSIGFRCVKDDYSK